MRKTMKKGGATKAEEAAGSEYESGCVFKLEGLPEECSRESIKEVLAPLGTVAWVDYSRGESSGTVRFAGGEAAAVKTKIEEDEIKFDGATPTITILEGDAEKAYWDNIAAVRQSKRSNSKGRNKRGRGGQRNSDSKRGHGDNEDGKADTSQPESKKAKTDNE